MAYVLFFFPLSNKWKVLVPQWRGSVGGTSDAMWVQKMPNCYFEISSASVTFVIKLLLASYF